MIALLSVAGCQSSSRSSAFDDGQIHVGVHYSARVARLCSPERNLDLVKRDFANIKKMKIDVVLIEDINTDDLDGVLEYAAENELKLIVPDREAINRVRGLALASQQSVRLPKSPSIVGYFLGHVVDHPSYVHAQKEANRIRTSHSNAKTFVRMDSSMISTQRVKAFDHVIAHSPHGSQDDPPSQAAGAFQTIRFGGNGANDDSTIRAWLLAYHRGLAKGQAAGLMIEGFRSLPGDGVGFVSRNAPLSPERITMVQRIANRAKRWQKVLTGLKPVNLVPLEESLKSVEVAMLANGPRRCVLITNPSTSDFARGDVSLPVELNAAPVVRAVVVPAESETVLGDVIRARSDRLVIPVKLAPGDAALYELF